MNTLLNTPLLTSTSLKKDFDNKIIMYFVVLLSVFALMILLFFDLTGVFGSSAQEDTNIPPTSIGDGPQKA